MNSKVITIETPHTQTTQSKYKHKKKKWIKHEKKIRLPSPRN